MAFIFCFCSLLASVTMLLAATEPSPVLLILPLMLINCPLLAEGVVAVPTAACDVTVNVAGCTPVLALV